MRIQSKDVAFLDGDTARGVRPQLDFLAEEGLIDVEDRDLFWYAETAAEILLGLLRWYELNNEPHSTCD